LDPDSDLDWDSETIGGMILTTESTLTGAMILSITATGTHLYTSISVSVSETVGIIIIMDGMAMDIPMIGTITGQHTIHIMIVMEIIIVLADIQLLFTRRDGIQATIPDLLAEIIYQEEKTPR
jgi:hypothetical protein